MSEKVAKLGLKREPGFLYYLLRTNVMRTPMKRGNSIESGGPMLAAVCSFKREPGFLYFLDAAGDVSRSKMVTGGTARHPIPKKIKEGGIELGAVYKHKRGMQVKVTQVSPSGKTCFYKLVDRSDVNTCEYRVTARTFLRDFTKAASATKPEPAETGSATAPKLATKS